jgi:hypothetical protein
MTHHLRRLATAALAPILLIGFYAGVAATATPAATFVTPTPGLVSVIQGGPFHVGWTISSGVHVTSTTVAIQASRPVGVDGCDPRWAPAGTASVSGTEYDLQAPTPNRCYRVALFLHTSTGTETVTSAPVIVAPGGWGPIADFMNPFADVVSYSTSTRIGWAERDTFGAGLVSRALFEQTAPAVNDSCAGVEWSAGVQVPIAGSTINRTLSRSNCYRYTVVLQDSAGFRSERTSGALRIAGGLPEWTGTLDLYRSTAFASQATLSWCVAASSQMMLNLVLDRSDTARASQATYMAYAQANDSATYSDGGSNPAGWVAVMNRYGGLPYDIGRYADRTSAIKAAATRMRVTNRPVGLLVWSGRHAWVMNGFEATADPALTSDFTVTAVYVSGPLYPRPANDYGYDPLPDTRLTAAQMATYFLPYYDTVLRTWNGSYLTIQP